MVEAKYHCSHHSWYKAQVLAVFPNHATYDVLYSDGDEDHDLGPKCLRPFVEYQNDDEIQVRTEGSEWLEGTIVRSYYHQIHPEDYYEDEEEVLNDLVQRVYDVNTNDGAFWKGIPSQRVRRFDKVRPLAKGDKVTARYQAGPEWFPGRIHKANDDGTYAIKYLDGDFEQAVPEDRIKRRAP